MKRKAMWTAVALVLLATLGAGQDHEQYLDVFSVQVKPEKRAAFDAISKKSWPPIVKKTVTHG
jgi:hypothetical protein